MQFIYFFFREVIFNLTADKNICLGYICSLNQTKMPAQEKKKKKKKEKQIFDMKLKKSKVKSKLKSKVRRGYK